MSPQGASSGSSTLVQGRVPDFLGPPVGSVERVGSSSVLPLRVPSGSPAVERSPATEPLGPDAGTKVLSPRSGGPSESDQTESVGSASEVLQVLTTPFVRETEGEASQPSDSHWDRGEGESSANESSVGPTWTCPGCNSTYTLRIHICRKCWKAQPSWNSQRVRMRTVRGVRGGHSVYKE